MKPQPVKEESTLHTQGEWFYEIAESNYNNAFIRSKENVDTIAVLPSTLKNYEANARRIVECVNSHDSLVKENKELRDVLNEVLGELKCYTWSKETYPVYDKAKAILNK